MERFGEEVNEIKSLGSDSLAVIADITKKENT